MKRKRKNENKYCRKHNLSMLFGMMVVVVITLFVLLFKEKKSYGINEAKVKYKNKRLTTIKDFNSVLGNGKEEFSEISSSYKYIKYNEDNCELILTILNEKIININISKK